MKPLELVLSGFRGVRSGLGLKRLRIDFREYRGLVALVGDNGLGKSTVLSNLHHYRIMPDRVKKYATKAFNFYDETYGPDALKIFISENNGEMYKSVVKIDAAKRKQEAYLYKWGANGKWEPYGDTEEGKLDVFDAAVEKLCGSPRMFFTSISRSQKAPALSSYPRSEMMDIFAELIDVEDHKARKESAGEIVDGLLSKRTFIVSEKDRLTVDIGEGERKAAEKVSVEERIVALAAEIAAGDEKLKALETSLRDLEIKGSLQGEAVKRQEKLTSDIGLKDKQLEELRTSAVGKKREYEGRYAEKKLAKETAEKRLPAAVAEISAGDENLKSLETSLRELEIKGSIQGEVVKRREKLNSDIESKEKELVVLRTSLTDKRALYNQRHKEKKVLVVGCEDLLRKAPELERKAGEEIAKGLELAGFKESLKQTEEQLATVAVMLKGVGVAETSVKESEKSLQHLQLARTHAIQTAGIALDRARKSARTLDEAHCVFPDKAASCMFVKAAAADRDALPALEEARKKAEVPDPQEKVLESEIIRLKEIAGTRPAAEQQEKSLSAQKESLVKSIDADDKALAALREDLKVLLQVEQAKVDLPRLKQEVAEILKEGTEVVQDLDKRIKGMETDLESLRAELKAITVDESLPKEVEQARLSVTTMKTAVESLRKEESDLKATITSLSDIETILKEGEVSVAEMEKRIKEMETDLESLRAELKAITVDESLPKEVEQAGLLVMAQKASLESLRKEEADHKIKEAALSESLKQIAAAVERVAILTSQLKTLDQDISEWQIVETAMEGIITLEIDDAGPTVSAITNDILFSCYGPRFAISIVTQTENAKGTAMREDFDIIVFDSERNEKKSLSVVSGGEETWLDDAIARGISLFNASRGGKHYQALFSDEKDGRLTEKRKKEFMAVKRKVLELGNFDAEFFISHTKEIQEMADAIIDLKDFKGQSPTFGIDEEIPVEASVDTEAEAVLF